MDIYILHPGEIGLPTVTDLPEKVTFSDIHNAYFPIDDYWRNEGVSYPVFPIYENVVLEKAQSEVTDV